MYYVPSVASAYNSVNFLRFQVPLGWLIHGLHFWAANAMVVLVLVHLGQVFIWGAYKKPRELTWLLGVGAAALHAGRGLHRRTSRLGREGLLGGARGQRPSPGASRSSAAG